MVWVVSLSYDNTLVWSCLRFDICVILDFMVLLDLCNVVSWCSVGLFHEVF